MEVSSVFSTAQDALNSNMVRFNELAQRIAANDGSSTSNYVTDLTEMQMLQRNYEANVEVIKSADEILSELLNL